MERSRYVFNPLLDGLRPWSGVVFKFEVIIDIDRLQIIESRPTVCDIKRLVASKPALLSRKCS